MSLQQRITENALVKRINRALQRDDEYTQLRKTRGIRAWSNLGDYYIINYQFNSVSDHHIDIEQLGRELNVLADYEHLEG